MSDTSKACQQTCFRVDNCIQACEAKVFSSITAREGTGGYAGLSYISVCGLQLLVQPVLESTTS
jgi:hypothetical protein